MESFNQEVKESLSEKIDKLKMKVGVEALRREIEKKLPYTFPIIADLDNGKHRKLEGCRGTLMNNEDHTPALLVSGGGITDMRGVTITDISSGLNGQVITIQCFNSEAETLNLYTAVSSKDKNEIITDAYIPGSN